MRALSSLLIVAAAASLGASGRAVAEPRRDRSSAPMEAAEPPSLADLGRALVRCARDKALYRFGLWPEGSRQLSEPLRAIEQQLLDGLDPDGAPLVRRGDEHTEVGLWEALDQEGRRIAYATVRGQRRHRWKTQIIDKESYLPAFDGLLEQVGSNVGQPRPAIVRFTHRHPPKDRRFSANDRRMATEMVSLVSRRLPGAQLEMGLVWSRGGSEPGKRLMHVGGPRRDELAKRAEIGE